MPYWIVLSWTKPKGASGCSNSWIVVKVDGSSVSSIHLPPGVDEGWEGAGVEIPLEVSIGLTLVTRVKGDGYVDRDHLVPEEPKECHPPQRSNVGVPEVGVGVLRVLGVHHLSKAVRCVVGHLL